MIATVQHMSDRLAEMLREQHDDGDPLLQVCWRALEPGHVLVTRYDGSELSASERAHVAAILAAHAAEPIR